MQIKAHEDTRAKARAAIEAEGTQLTPEQLEVEVKKMVPDRDFDEEELDEQGRWLCCETGEHGV